MELKEILRLMAEKYPDEVIHFFFTKLLLETDGSGCIYQDDPFTNALFEFHSTDELIQHLQEK